MMYFWLFFLIGLVALYQVSRYRIGVKVLHSQYRLYELRDDLRELVMKERVRKNNWIFQYMDSTISKLIDALPTLTIWHALALVLVHGRDERLRANGTHLSEVLGKPENAGLAEIYQRMVMVIGVFLVDRHDILRNLAFRAVEAIAIGRALKGFVRQLSELQAQAPETSTLDDFARAA